MSVKIFNINVGEGDCLLIRTETISIMVDCGKFNNNVKKTLTENKITKLDLVIATHIDNDHICGLCDLLKEIKVDNILFNGFHHIPLEKSNNIPKEISKEIFNKLKSYSSYFKISNNNETIITAEQSFLLSDIINERKIAWNTLLGGERLSVDNKKEINFNDFTIKLLSPNDTKLKDTYNQYRKFIYEKTGELLGKDKLEDISKSLYEIALYENNVNIEEYCINAVLPLSANSIHKLATENTTKDTSITNGASLAFILEIENKTILMLGDAHPDVVISSLKQLNEGRISYFNAIKVAHHGSAKNTTSELLEHIDSPIYIFSGGDVNSKPSEYTISKIIDREIPDNQIAYQRSLYFNRDDNKIVNNFKKATNVADELSFKIIINKEMIEL